MKDFGIDIALEQEKELSLYLGNGVAPQVQGKCRGGSAKDCQKVILPELDGLLRNILPVVVGGNELVSHS